MLQRFQSLFQVSGRMARKTARVWIRPAGAAEYIETHTADGLETANVAQAGDMVVKNTTEAGECYLLAAEVVQKRYIPTGNTDGIWEEMAPVAHTWVLLLTPEVLSQTALEAPFHFMARWQEPMIAKRYDYLAMPPDNTEIYRIAAKEFDETYQFEPDNPTAF